MGYGENLVLWKGSIAVVLHEIKQRNVKKVENHANVVAEIKVLPQMNTATRVNAQVTYL